jgi:hypothetical protein
MFIVREFIAKDYKKNRFKINFILEDSRPKNVVQIFLLPSARQSSRVPSQKSTLIRTCMGVARFMNSIPSSHCSVPPILYGVLHLRKSLTSRPLLALF